MLDRLYWNYKTPNPTEEEERKESIPPWPKKGSISSEKEKRGRGKKKKKKGKLHLMKLRGLHSFTCRDVK